MKRHGFIPALLAMMSISVHCGDSADDGGGGPLDDEASVHALFDAIAADLAVALTDVNQAERRAFRANPTNCPGGGTLAYTPPGVGVFIGQITLTGCNFDGAIADGTISGSLEIISGDNGSLVVNGGSITMSGKFTGALQLQNGTISWDIPATRSNTFWNVRVSIGGGTPFCATNQAIPCQ